jgi:nitroimidazol reductase NimA-like FMN-containing flavoprotein (pyridoxamine 5'-phosphate oxidase superfamily)
MRKQEKEITNREKIYDILKRGKYTILSLCRDNEPYIVTLSYGFDDKRNSLYLHTANQGLKIEFIKKNSSICGTVIEDRGYKMNKCSHAYCSIVFWGKISVIKDLKEKKYAFNVLLNHLEDNPNKIQKKFLKKDTDYYNTCLLRLDIIEITGKKSL